MKQEEGPQPKEHELRVKREVFSCIEDGSKKYEIRVNTYRMIDMNIKVNDVINFVDGSDNSVKKPVKRIMHHHSLEDFLEEVDNEDIMPVMTYEQLLSAWREIGGEKEKHFGIVVFEIN